MSLALPQLPKDKANHVVYGSAVALSAQTAVALLPLAGVNLHGIRPQDVGLAASTLFAVGKEAVDWVLNKLAVRRGEKPKYHVEPLDALATISGGAAIWLAQL